MGRALEAALAKLREFNAAHERAGAPTSAQQARRMLVTEAGHALWMFVVHGRRAACATAAPSCGTTMCRARCSGAWGPFIALSPVVAYDP
jgi:hypothetical protein